MLLRHTQIFGGGARTNHVRVQLWLARVREIADSRDYLRGRYRKDHLNLETLRYISRLSWMPDGPRLAVNFLAERGIALVIEPHLSPTRLDGAAMIGRNGAPVIGLTVREDRLDNFWFTLLHELVHAWRHLDPERALDSRTESPPGHQLESSFDGGQVFKVTVIAQQQHIVSAVHYFALPRLLNWFIICACILPFSSSGTSLRSVRYNDFKNARSPAVIPSGLS